jgi:predicted transcriptional regulator
MDHLTIPIRDGLDERRKADLAEWLTDLASQVTDASPAVDDDPVVRAEAVQRGKRGMAEVAAGLGVDGREAMRRIAEKNGFSLPR